MCKGNSRFDVVVWCRFQFVLGFIAVVCLVNIACCLSILYRYVNMDHMSLVSFPLA